MHRPVESLDLADIKGKWDPASMKYKVGQKVRYVAGGFYPATIRAIEAGGGSSALWQTLDAAGFLDALVPESAGGQGLSLADTAELEEAPRQRLPLDVLHHQEVGRAAAGQPAQVGDTDVGHLDDVRVL